MESRTNSSKRLPALTEIESMHLLIRTGSLSNTVRILGILTKAISLLILHKLSRRNNRVRKGLSLNNVNLIDNDISSPVINNVDNVGQMTGLTVNGGQMTGLTVESKIEDRSRNVISSKNREMTT